MQLASYRFNDQDHVGVVRDGHVYPFWDKALDMIAIAAEWPNHRQQAEQALAGIGHPLADVQLLPPITHPRKVMAIGLNYADHIQEARDAGHDLVVPESQTWFAKAISSLNGPFDPVELPKASPDSVDYEAELVVVIGKTGRNIPIGDAHEHIFGYCVGNDVSVRAWQMLSTQWGLAKSFDTHAPIGPWITTADDVQDPHNLAIRCWINDELRQNSNTREQIHKISAQIEFLSKAMTLLPGDLIFTGTAGGVGFLSRPPIALAVGDRMRVEIESLGAIENICVSEQI